MPQQRTLLAADAQQRIERVQAHRHSGDWGPTYRAPERRWVLPGSGDVQWRNAHEQLLVDELTAFHLAPGELYQLQYERARDHVVLIAPGAAASAPAHRGWLVSPAQLLQWRLAWRRLGEGQPAGAAAAVAGRILARARPLSASPAPQPLLRARRFLVGEQGRGHGLEVLAEVAGASPFQLARLFRRHLGLPIHQYRLRLRLAGALARMQQGERDLAGLAHDLGFASQSHFGAVFLREVGVTPGEARRALAPT